MRGLQKLASVLFVLVILGSGAIAQTQAQAQRTQDTEGTVAVKVPIQPALKEIQDHNIDVKTEGGNLGKFADDNLNKTAAAFVCLLSREAAGCEEKQTGTTKADASGSKNFGAYGSIISLVSGMYKYQPAKTDRYVASVLQDMHITITGGAQPVYAQGLGFAALDPILGTWKIFRNIAYMGFIIIFVAIGFMIMFRQKIGSQTVVTVELAIPNIVVALITVTFSYAIAGLLIDMMYLLMFFMAGLFNRQDLISGNVFQLSFNLLNSGAATTGADQVGEFVNDLMGGGIVSHITAVIANLTALIIIWLVIVFNSFKLFFNLLKVYVDIILNIAFAPVILMSGAIPGQNAFANWIKNLIANLAVFPGILLLLLIFHLLQQNISNVSGGFNPPYLGGTGSGSYLPALVGLALILALPEAVEEIKKALGASQSGIFGTLIQAGLKNANAQRGRAAGILGGAALGAVGGAVVGRRLGTEGVVGNTSRSSINRATLAGAGVGMLSGPVAGVGTGLVSGVAGSALRYASYLPGAVTTMSSIFPRLNRFLNTNQTNDTRSQEEIEAARQAALAQINSTPPLPFDVDDDERPVNPNTNRPGSNN